MPTMSDQARHKIKLRQRKAENRANRAAKAAKKEKNSEKKEN